MRLVGWGMRSVLAGLPGREVGLMSEGLSGRGVVAAAEREPGREGSLVRAGRSAPNVVPIPVPMPVRRDGRLGRPGVRRGRRCRRWRGRWRWRRWRRWPWRWRRDSGARSFTVARSNGRTAAACRRPARRIDRRARCRTTDGLWRAAGHRRGRAGVLRGDRLVVRCLAGRCRRRHGQQCCGRRSGTETGACSDRREVCRARIEEHDHRGRDEQQRSQRRRRFSRDCPD
jgi:hypothetical protein